MCEFLGISLQAQMPLFISLCVNRCAIYRLLMFIRLIHCEPEKIVDEFNRKSTISAHASCHWSCCWQDASGLSNVLHADCYLDEDGDYLVVRVILEVLKYLHHCLLSYLIPFRQLPPFHRHQPVVVSLATDLKVLRNVKSSPQMNGSTNDRLFILELWIHNAAKLEELPISQDRIFHHAP